MRKIPFSPPDITQAEIDEVVKVLSRAGLLQVPKQNFLKAVLQNIAMLSVRLAFLHKPLAQNLHFVFSVSDRATR